MGTIILTSVVEEEGEQFVSRCLELGTASCGDTIQEALANLEEAIEVHIGALEETGEIGRVLREQNIAVKTHPIEETAQMTVPLGKLVKTTQHRVPVPA